jgi:4'-phosphopantetheinyl transferase
MLLFDEANDLSPPAWSSRFPPRTTLDQTIHIFRADLDVHSTHTDRFASFLSADEMARARRFHFDRDRMRYSIARGLLRALIGRYLSCHPASLSFRYNSCGKPYLRCPRTNLSFNVSHSQGMALYAFAGAGELGIDVAWRDPKVRGEEIASRFFTSNECLFIERASSSGILDPFFYLWSRKEAYIKAVSKGLSVPLNEFDIATSSSVGGFQIYSFVPKPDFSAALAVQPSPSEILFFDVDQMKLV